VLAIAIPDTILEEKESLREKTSKLGSVARACAIYGVDLVQIFRDRSGKGELPLIRTVLEYLETPQYMRRRLFPINESLKFAGLLPPLRIPSHKPKIDASKIRPGEVREGVSNPDGTVDIGLDVNPVVGPGLPGGRRVTVRIVSINPLRAEAVPREKVEDYWGYKVESKEVLELLAGKGGFLNIATSRLGDPLGASLSRLRTSMTSAGSIRLLFGSPSRGLFDIVGKDLRNKSQFVVNLFPEQHVETVRTEEAIFAGLGLVATLAAEKA